MIAWIAGFCEMYQAANIRLRITSPCQNAEKLPATKPDRMFSEAPPWRDEVDDFLHMAALGGGEDLGELGDDGPGEGADRDDRREHPPEVRLAGLVAQEQLAGDKGDADRNQRR